MAATKYSKVETNFDGEEDFEYTPEVRLRRPLNRFNSLWLATTVAFCVGILATFGAIRLRENIRNHDTDWLSKWLKCSTILFSQIHGKVKGMPGNLKVQFEYNDTYPGPPTLESEYAWLDLLPGKIALMLTAV